jgi:hypothetical protein
MQQPIDIFSRRPVTPIEFDFEFDHPGEERIVGSVYMPFDRGESPHDLGYQNIEWTVDMGMLGPFEPGFRGLLKGGFEALAKLVYRDDAWDDVALATNFMTMLFVFDDMVDSEYSPIGTNYELAYAVTEYLMAATMGDLPDDLPSNVPYRDKICGLGAALIDIHCRLLDRPGSPDLTHYYASMRDYFDGVVAESRNRSIRSIRHVDDYAAMRLQFSAVLPCFELGLIMRGLTVSDEVRALPAFRSMQRAAILSVSYINDLFSYRKEWLAGERSNLVMVFERTEGCGRAAAFHHACETHTEVVRDFHGSRQSMREQLRSDSGAAYYVKLMEYWMRGNMDWTVENRTQRYSDSSKSDTPVAHSTIEHTGVYDLDGSDDDAPVRLGGR